MISCLLILKTLVILEICRQSIRMNIHNCISQQEVFLMHKCLKEIHNLNLMINKRNKIIIQTTQKVSLKNSHLIHNIISTIIKELLMFLNNKRYRKYNLHLSMSQLKVLYKPNKISEDL